MKLNKRTANAIVNDYLTFREHIIEQIGMYNNTTDVPVTVNESTVTMMYRMYTDQQNKLWK